MIQVCLDQSWPQDKPVAQIVFPKLLPTRSGNLVTLWVMLPKQEIQNRLFSKFQKELIFTESPHPMLLWTTQMITQQQEDRWLPCYLDLKDSKGEEIARCLAEKGFYYLLFFAMEEPQYCTEVMAATLNRYQTKMLTKWANTSQSLQPIGRPSASKRLLKQELDKLKSNPAIFESVSQIA